MEFLQAGLPVFLGSLLQGCTGFGFSLLAVPLLLFFFEGTLVIPLLVLLSLAMNGAVWIDCGSHLSRRTLGGLLLGGVAGLLPGLWILNLFPASALRLTAGLFVTASALALLLGFRRPLPPRLWALLAVGFASGLLNGSLSMSGPPVILFLANQGADKNVFRSTLAGYFLSLNVVTTVLFLAKGMITRPTMGLYFACLPALAAGTLLGIVLARRVPERLFRLLALVVLISMGLSLTASALKP